MAWFIDWLSGRIPVSEPLEINGGRVMFLDRHGALEHTLDRRLQIEPSHDARIQIRTVGDALEFSGNPAKLLQGHNLWGPDDVRLTCFLLAWSIFDHLELEPAPQDFARWFAGDIALSRVDCTRMYRPPDAPPGWVPKWLSIASGVAHGGHQRITNRGAYEGNTLYVGQHSRRISMKIYDKSAELKRHPARGPAMAGEAPFKGRDDTLSAYASGTLRVEVTIRSMELKERGLDRAAAWSRTTGAELLDERISKLDALEGLRMTEEEVNNLPRRLQAVYALWHDGHDLRQMYRKTQFYQYRSALLAYGVDIANVRPHQIVTERAHALGKPLKDFITGPGLEPPEDDAVASLWRTLSDAIGS